MALTDEEEKKLREVISKPATPVEPPKAPDSSLGGVIESTVRKVFGERDAAEAAKAGLQPAKPAATTTAPAAPKDFDWEMK